MEIPGENLVIKLWETLADKGVGSLLKPWQTIREGRAKNEVRRQELLMLAQAETDAAEIRAGRMRIGKGGDLQAISFDSGYSQLSSVSSRIEPGLNFSSIAINASLQNAARVAKSEINTCRAVIYAEEQLVSDSQLPPERSVEDDWLFAWKDYAGKVSTEDLQRLWGSVLAGEIKSPGKYSLRTLEFLKSISREEAELIGKIASFALESRIIRTQSEYLEKQGISFGLLLQMEDLGILSGVGVHNFTTTYISSVTDRFVRAFHSGGKALVAQHEDAGKSLALNVYNLTNLGSQILELGRFQPDLEYLRLVGKEIASQGYTVSLHNWAQPSENEDPQYFDGESIEK